MHTKWFWPAFRCNGTLDTWHTHKSETFPKEQKVIFCLLFFSYNIGKYFYCLFPNNYSKGEYTFLNRRYLITEETSFGSQSSRLKMLHFLHVHELRFEDNAEADGATGCSLLLFLDEASTLSWCMAAATAAELNKNRLWTLDDRLPRLPIPAPQWFVCGSSELPDDRRLLGSSKFPAAVGCRKPCSNCSSLKSSSACWLLKYWLMIVLGMTKQESDYFMLMLLR